MPAGALSRISDAAIGTGSIPKETRRPERKPAVEDVVRQEKTNLPCEDVIARAVRHFSAENWQATSQAPGSATFQGTPEPPWFALRRRDHPDQLSVTAMAIGGGTVVVVQFPKASTRLVAGFLEGLRRCPGDGAGAAEEAAAPSPAGAGSPSPAAPAAPVQPEPTRERAGRVGATTPATVIAAVFVLSVGVAGYWFQVVRPEPGMSIPAPIVTDPAAADRASPATTPVPSEPSATRTVAVPADTSAPDPIVQAPAAPAVKAKSKPSRKRRAALRRVEATPVRREVPPAIESRQAVATPPPPVQATVRAEGNRIDELYRKRVAATCAPGLAGLFCREKIRFCLCDGRWTAERVPGMTRCHVARSGAN